MNNLYEHQKQSFLKFKDRALCADLSDPGTGKTRVQIALLLYRKSRLNLIVAPPSTLRPVWKTQLDEKFDKECQIVLDKGSAKALETIEHIIQNKGAQCYNVIVSYDTAKLILPKKKKMTFGLNRIFWQTIILDESTKIKNPKSMRTKRILMLRGQYKSIMTGTVAPNSLMDVFPQFCFLSEQIFGASWFYYREKYFTKNIWNEYQYDLKKGSLEAIRAKMEPYSMQHKKSDCLELPPVVYETRECDMGASQRKAYKQMKEEMIVWLKHPGDGESRAITAPFAITKLMKMRQISAGFLYEEEDKIYDFKHQRTNCLIDIIEQIPGKVIVFAHFKHSIKIVQDALNKNKISNVVFTGKAREIEHFKNSCKVFIANPISAGHGLNLQFASDIIYYEKDFNLETYLQSIKRIDRIGQKNKMTIWNIEASPIDRYISKKLALKQDVLSQLDINTLRNEL